MKHAEHEALRFLAEPLLQPVFVVDVHGAVVWLNPWAAQRWPDAVGAAAPTLFPESNRPDFVAAMHKALSTGEGARFEWGEHGQGGVRAWFIGTVAAVRSNGLITGAWCSSTEVTEHKRIEERLRRSEQLMADTQGVAHLGIWEWDLAEPTASWSDELYRIYGLTRATYTPSYEGYLKMVHPEDRQRVIDATNLVFQQAVPYSHDERIIRPDGSIRYLHTWAHPLRDAAGKLIRLVGVCQDITDQKRAEEALHRVNAELERRVDERTQQLKSSMRDLESFNAMVSHDLRTPLQAIQLSADLLARDTSLPQSTTAPLKRIRGSVKHMSRLIEDLLTLARVGQTEVHRTEVDLSMLCVDLLSDLRRAEPEREVEVEIAPGLRCSADAVLMRSVMSNLLSNAWKYSSRLPFARIEVGPVAARPNAFFVRDNGAGFEMAQKHRLFVPFERLHPATEFTGTGVGLATVHRIVDRHGGAVWAESEPGRGATFFVELPT